MTWPCYVYIWHRYLTCYHLTPDTWHLIYDIWQLTCYLSLDMLSPGASTYDLLLWHLTGYYYTWHLYYMAYSWLSLLWGLGMNIILWPDLCYSWTPALLNSWTLVSPVLMSLALLLLLIAQPYQRPAEPAWCRDDEDVSHARASVRRLLNGTKCHTE